jgi:hypothetical protein
MQQQGSSPSMVFITTMDTQKSCKVNELMLDGDDLIIAEHLKTGYYKQNGDTMQFVEPIKANDTVLIVKINNEQYAIIERLVSL